MDILMNKCPKLPQYSRRGHPSAEQSGTISSLYRVAMLCLMPPRTRLALLAARTLLTHIQLTINQDSQVVESPSLEVFRNCLDAILCNGLWDDPALAGRFDQVTGSFQPSPFCDSVILQGKDEDGHLANRDRDKAEVFNAFFASVFSMDDGPRGSQCPDLEDNDYENDQLPVDPETAWDLLFQLDPYKSVGPDS
ncbi:hypothetical protein BTVI_10858 [Pitangus sulphuratus]|nr:hypothetical protein BTVI_10858 [Pitangus sulphuratus]